MVDPQSSQRLARPTIDQIGNGIQLLLTITRQNRCIWQVLAHQTIGVLLGASLLRAVLIAEIHDHARAGC
jgi:hypothetical protein